MKFSQRLLSALLCFALLFPAFSIGVSAADVTIEKLTITDTVAVINDWGTNTHSFTFYSNDDVYGTEEYIVSKGIPTGTLSVTVRHGYLVQPTNGSPIIKEGQVSKISLHNAYINQYAQSTTLSPPIQYFRQIDTVRALVYFSDGTMKYYDDVSAEKPDNYHNNFTFSIDPQADVLKIEYITTSTFRLNSAATANIGVYVYPGENTTADANISLEIETKEEKLLSGIIEWLKGIKEGITGLFDNVTTGFSNIVTKITDTIKLIGELPGKLWTLIENGLKNLFVPSTDFMLQYKNDIDVLLREKFGAVYEVINLTFDTMDRIKESDQTDTISMPSASIDLTGGNKFTFGGYDVQIVPSALQPIVGYLKLIVGIVCTLMFLNGLRKRYDEIMGVE